MRKIHQLHQVKEKISALQANQQNRPPNWIKCAISLQKCRGQQSSLEALQQTALGQRNNRQVEWLAQHQSG